MQQVDDGSVAPAVVDGSRNQKNATPASTNNKRPPITYSVLSFWEWSLRPSMRIRMMERSRWGPESVRCRRRQAGDGSARGRPEDGIAGRRSRRGGFIGGLPAVAGTGLQGHDAIVASDDQIACRHPLTTIPRPHLRFAAQRQGHLEGFAVDHGGGGVVEVAGVDVGGFAVVEKGEVVDAPAALVRVARTGASTDSPPVDNRTTIPVDTAAGTVKKGANEDQETTKHKGSILSESPTYHGR